MHTIQRETRSMRKNIIDSVSKYIHRKRAAVDAPPAPRTPSMLDDNAPACSPPSAKTARTNTSTVNIYRAALVESKALYELLFAEYNTAQRWCVAKEHTYAQTMSIGQNTNINLDNFAHFDWGTEATKAMVRVRQAKQARDNVSARLQCVHTAHQLLKLAAAPLRASTDSIIVRGGDCWVALKHPIDI